MGILQWHGHFAREENIQRHHKAGAVASSRRVNGCGAWHAHAVFGAGMFT
jgi:hypothetical protein